MIAQGRDLRQEMKNAVRQIEYKRRQYMLATNEYEVVAWHELIAAQARLDALIIEAKGEE
jgi:hypothetical protein